MTRVGRCPACGHGKPRPVYCTHPWHEPVWSGDSGDEVDDFMTHVSEWVALTAFRLAHSPGQPDVPAAELEAFARAKNALRVALRGIT